MNQPKIGWIGLGNMGNPMVKNLLKAGFAVKVYNRTQAKDAEVTQAGATAVDNPKELAEQSDVVLVMVSDDAAAKNIFNELLSGESGGKLFVNVSTVSTETSKQLDELCKAKGAAFLEAPVSGSVKPAQDGTLIVLVGGEDKDLDNAKSIFDALGKLTLHIGPVGTGSAAKLAINYLVALNMQGLAETVLFANQGGVSTETMLTIINEGGVGNITTKAKTPAILKNEYPPAFALKHLVKDLRLMRDQGLNEPLSANLINTYENALNNGFGEEDSMAVIKYLKDKKDK